MFFSLFKQTHHTSEIEEDKILRYTLSLLADSSLSRIFADKYHTYLQLPNESRAAAAISLYVALEEVILNNKPPIVKQEYTKQSLRSEIQSHLTFTSLQPSCQILFLDEAAQRQHIYIMTLSQMIQSMAKTVDQARISYVVATAVKGTILESAEVSPTGIEFQLPPTSTKPIDINQLTELCRRIYRLLYEELYISMGEVQSIQIAQGTFKIIRSTYDHDMTSYFFDILPQGVLETERLSFMSRDALEKQVVERTKELEDAKLNLEEKVIQRTREVEESKQHVETILKSIGDAVFAVDLAGNIILMNKIAEELSGFTFAEAKGQHYTKIFRFTSEQQPNVPYFPFVEKVIQEGAIQQLKSDTLIVKRDGTRTPISDSAAPIQDRDGKILGCVVVFRNAYYERELERAKDTFLSIAAHQLRTPLGAIRWNLEMLLAGDMGEVSAEVKSIIEQMYESDKRLITLVNDLLNVSRIDQNRVVYQPIMINILDIIKEAIADIQVEATKKGIQIQLQFNEADNFILLIDKKHFREAMENVISNAVKYSYAAGEVVVKVEKIDLFISITVIDHGIGIPENDKSKMFTKFFRAENAMKSATEGSGLGLFVVKSFVESLGGSVMYESRVGSGTTFFIKIPTNPHFQS